MRVSITKIIINNLYNKITKSKISSSYTSSSSIVWTVIDDDEEPME